MIRVCLLILLASAFAWDEVFFLGVSKPPYDQVGLYVSHQDNQVCFGVKKPGYFKLIGQCVLHGIIGPPSFEEPYFYNFLYLGYDMSRETFINAIYSAGYPIIND